MKWIVYKFKTTMQTTDENGELVDKEIIGVAKKEYSAANEEIVKREAYNGEYTIEDDNIEDIQEPTKEDKFEAQLTYTAMMTGTLLEEV